MATVFIKGLGLIGSSIARAIRQEHPTDKIIADDINNDSLTYALQQHLIDQSSHNWDNINTADFIILASPVSQIIQDLHSLSKISLKKGVIVTDVGSTKQVIMKASQALTTKGISFIGGHPMAGSHLTGVKAGRSDLFSEAYYFLVGSFDKQAAKQLKDLLVGLNVKWLNVSAQEHDLIVAQISHVPHVIAAALVNQTKHALTDLPGGMKLAAGGFKSVTRIAASDPTMWCAIMASNRENISQQLGDYIKALSKAKKAIDNNDQKRLRTFFGQAQAARQSLDRRD